MDNFDNNENDSKAIVKYNFKNRFKKNLKIKKLLSYIAVGLICSFIGGGISIASFLYLLPNTGFFRNTPLYESINSNKNTITTSQTQASTISTNSTTGLTVAEIAKKVSPAVVGVSIKTGSQDNFFGFSNDENSDESDGMGSGIIISSDGYILTNYHVVQSAQSITVILNNNKEVPAKVINYDADQDLAVIKVTQSTTMPAVAELGDSDKVQVGDPVVAIGNPLGKELLGSVTSGIISATKRQISTGSSTGSTSSSTQTFLQTDAAINAGNSGGALVNSLGQVIGINSAKIGGNGVEGIGFAIPINTAKSKLNGLLKPALKIGIAGRDIDSTLSKEYNMPEGVYVAEVEEFSPAEKAGLKVGDIIQKFDGKSIKSVSEINDIKATHQSGDTVSVTVYRDGSTKNLDLKLSE